MLKDLMILMMQSFLKLVADKLLSKLRTTNFGSELSFIVGAHFEVKTLLKSLAFSLKPASSLLPTFSGGINRFFCFFCHKESYPDRPICFRWVDQLLR